MQIPPLAFECQLWSIRPNVARYPLNTWPTQALDYVCSLILERQVEAEIKAVVRNIVKCDITLDQQNYHRNYRNNETTRFTLRNCLISKGFAETANEEHIFEVDFYRIVKLKRIYILFPYVFST